MPIDRCVCYAITFAELLRLQRRTNASLEQLQTQTRCGTSCGLCLPYIRRSLETGEVSFPAGPGLPSDDEGGEGPWPA